MSADDWRMLAYYSWDTDEQQLWSKPRRSRRRCSGSRARLSGRPRRIPRRGCGFSALVAAATAKDAKPREDKAAAADLHRVLADPRLARENFDLLTYYADKVVRATSRRRRSPRARELAADWNAALERFVADRALSTADRLSAVSAQIALAKLDTPKGALPDPAAATRARPGGARRSRDDRSLRAAGGDQRSSRRAVRRRPDARLRRAARGRAQALAFAVLLHARPRRQRQKARRQDGARSTGTQKAYAAADGPATRLQWGVRYVKTLIELAPQDATRHRTGGQERDR